jgi:hypothetical protein
MRAATTSLPAEDMAPSTLTQQQTSHARTLPHKQERLLDVTKEAAGYHKGGADCYKEAADQRRAIRHFYDEEGINE